MRPAILHRPHGTLSGDYGCIRFSEGQDAAHGETPARLGHVRRRAVQATQATRAAACVSAAGVHHSSQIRMGIECRRSMERPSHFDIRGGGASRLSPSCRCLTCTRQALAVGIAPGLFFLPYRMHQRSRNAGKSYSEVKSEAREEADDRRKGVRDRVRELNAKDD